jgi:hypothetical protein
VFYGFGAKTVKYLVFTNDKKAVIGKTQFATVKAIKMGVKP